MTSFGPVPGNRYSKQSLGIRRFLMTAGTVSRNISSSITSFILLAALTAAPVFAKDKNKSSLPAYVLQARTVLVVIYPGAGEPLDQPYANSTARENVENALMDWGRFDLVMSGQDSDLVIAVRTGNGKMMQPNVHGGPIGQRPGTAEGSDTTIRIGAQQGPTPPLTQPGATPPDRGTQVGNEVGPPDDTFEVYRGNVEYPLDSAPAWRYSKKDCLSAPDVAAVEEFRKAIADAEKQQQTKKP
jgi:hypothetical protein